MGRRSAPPELLCRCGSPRRRGHAASGILVPENHAALVEIIGRHLDSHAVSRERLNAVLAHLAGGVSNQGVAVVELNAISRIREKLLDDTLKFNQLFF